MAIVDEKANIVQSYEYSAFGECLSGKDAVNAFRFGGGFGGQTDDDTGLVYFWNRWYDPKVGRWISEDPIRQSGGLNMYGYAGNNPAVNIDEFGLAYFAKRKLKNGSWLPKGLPIDDKLNTELVHEQLFFEDGKLPSNLGYFDDGQPPHPDSPNVNPYNIYVPGKYNDCVMRKAVSKVTPAPYCLNPLSSGKYQCQDWAEAVRVKYSELANDRDCRKECCLDR